MEQVQETQVQSETWARLYTYDLCIKTNYYSVLFFFFFSKQKLEPKGSTMMRRGGSSKRRPKQNNNVNDENWSYRPLQQLHHHQNNNINHKQKDQPCCSSSSSSQFSSKVALNLNVPTLVVLNNQESDSLTYAGKDETNKGKEVCLSDELNASKKDCAEYEDEDAYEDDDVLKKLEILRLSCQEADLSDDVFKDNDQLQQDEVKR